MKQDFIGKGCNTCQCIARPALTSEKTPQITPLLISMFQNTGVQGGQQEGHEFKPWPT